MVDGQIMLKVIAHLELCFIFYDLINSSSIFSSNFICFTCSDRCCFHNGTGYEMGDVIDVTVSNCTEVNIINILTIFHCGISDLFSLWQEERTGHHGCIFLLYLLSRNPHESQ